MTQRIKNARVIDPSQGLDEIRDIFIEDGFIKETGSNLADGSEPTVDCRGLVLAPGLIDIHVHGRTPGQEYKEDTASLTKAAAQGGFTQVCVMPNTVPPIDKRSVVEDILARARTEGNGVKIGPIASVSVAALNEQLAEFAELKAAGIVAVSDDAFPLQDSGFIRRVFQYAKTCDLLVMLHCEDTTLTGGGHAGVGKGGGVMNEGIVSNELGLRGMPPVSEAIAVYKACVLAEFTGCRIHILHVSTAAAVELIREFKAKGVPVTGEAGPHHFALTDQEVRGYNTNAKMNPPLRTQADCDAIIAGFGDGTLDAVATDHAPHAAHEKQREFDHAPFGIIGLETALPIALKTLVTDGPLSLSQLIEKMSCAPARLLGLSGGTLKPGAPADLVLFDPDCKWKLDATQLASKSKNTPFHGREMTGRVEATFVDGNCVYRQSKQQLCKHV